MHRPMALLVQLFTSLMFFMAAGMCYAQPVDGEGPWEGDGPPPHVLVPVRSEENGLVGFTSGSGRSLAPVYEEVGWFEAGVAPVKLNGKWGLIDTLGRTVTEMKYDLLSNSTNGIALGYTSDGAQVCILRMKEPEVCVAWEAYWAAWKQELEATVLADKVLILRVLEMHRDPASRLKEMTHLQQTYQEVIQVRDRAVDRVLRK
ncbi:MAG: WG repeat-containing protein [Flavobacteriales bacterium]